MSHSKFYSSLVLLILLNAVIKPVWIFGIDRQVQNITGVAEYGIYFSLFNLSVVFGFLLDWGLNNFINRELAAKRSNLQEQLASLLLIKILFFIVYCAVVFTVARLSGVHRWDILVGVMIVQFLTFLFLFLRNVVTANQWFTTDAYLSVLDKSLMILVCGALILSPTVFGMINIDRFILAQIACTAIATLAVIFILLSRGIVFRSPGFSRFNRDMIMSVLPYALVIFLMSIHIRLDGFLLERLRPDGAHQAGIYAGAYRLLDASNMVGYLVASFSMPFVARLWTEGKHLRDIILQTRHVQIMFAVTISVIAVIMAPQLQKILYHRDDPEGVTVLRWCLPALAGYALTQVYGTVMTATGNVRSFCLFNMGAVIINIALNLILIPSHGALGCCIAALSSQLVLGVSCAIYVHRKLHSPVNVKSFFAYVLNGLLTTATLLILMRTSTSILLCIGAAFLINFFLMWITRLISLNSWLGFLKKQ